MTKILKVDQNLIFPSISLSFSLFVSQKTKKKCYNKDTERADVLVMPIISTNIHYEIIGTREHGLLMEINKGKLTYDLAQKWVPVILNLSFCDPGSVHEGLAPVSCSRLPRLHHQVHPGLCTASEQILDAAEDPASGLRWKPQNASMHEHRPCSETMHGPGHPMIARKCHQM